MSPASRGLASLAMRACLAALVLLACSLPATAHAVLVSSSPKNNATVKAAPKRVVLRFDARIEKPVTQVTLFDSKGKKVALPPAPNGYSAGPANQLSVPMPSLKPGAYRLEYRVLATDGHLTPGLVRFTVAGGKAP